MLKFVLALNALWFALGFHLFWMRGKVFAKVVVPRENRDTPVLETLIMSGKFLGGFNLAFAVLTLLLLLHTDVFDKDLQWSIVLFACAIAHGTQFAANVPVAIQNRRGSGVWQIKGLILFIFVTDLTLMIANGILALRFYS